MAQSSRPNFPHRANRDGTTDSICAGCYRTIANSLHVFDLEVAEGTHNCKGFHLGEILHGVEKQWKPYVSE